MAYVYNGKARSYTLEITQNIGGVDYTFNPPLNMIQNFPGSGGAITEEQFYRLSSVDFTTRVNAYYAYIMIWNPAISLPGDIVVGPEIENPDCEGVVPIDTTLAPDTDTEAPDTNPDTDTEPDTNPDTGTDPLTQSITLDCADFGVTFTNGWGGDPANNTFEAWVQLESPTIETLTFTVEFYAVRPEIEGVLAADETTQSLVVVITEGNDYNTNSTAFASAHADENWVITGWKITAVNHTYITTVGTPYPTCGTWPGDVEPEVGTCYSIWIPTASQTSGADSLYIEYRNPDDVLVDVDHLTLPETGEWNDGVVINLCSMIFPLFQYGPSGPNQEPGTIGITVYTGGTCTINGECVSPPQSTTTTTTTTTVQFIEHIYNTNYLVWFENFLPGSPNVWEAEINFTNPLPTNYTFIIEFTATRNDVPDTYVGQITLFGAPGATVVSESSTTGLSQDSLESWTVTAYEVIQIQPNEIAYTFEPYPTPTTV